MKISAVTLAVYTAGCSCSPVHPPARARDIKSRVFDRDTDLYANWPSYDDLPLDASYPTKAAWGVWGADDELGALNHITNATILSASQGIELGFAIPLNLELDIPTPPTNPARKPLQHLYQPGKGYTDDVVVMNTQISTQFDGLRHYPYSTNNSVETYRWYNDLIADYDDVIGPAPTRALGVHVAAQKGIAVRGVLLDWAGWKDARNETFDAFAQTSITTDELDAVAAWQGLPADWSRPGDMLILRTGWLRQYQALNETQDALLPLQGEAWVGVEPSEQSLRWLWEKKFSLVGGDNPAFESVSRCGPSKNEIRACADCPLLPPDSSQQAHPWRSSVSSPDIHWWLGPEYRRVPRPGISNRDPTSTQQVDVLHDHTEYEYRLRYRLTAQCASNLVSSRVERLGTVGGISSLEYTCTYLST